MDHQPRSRVCKKKRRRDRLIALAEENPGTWVIGFEDECWWSRLARPSLNSWVEEGEPLRLIEQSVAKDDPDPKAISCYGLYVPKLKKTWLRFVDGRPLSTITTRFLDWCSEKLQAVGKKVWVLIWDNASWHISHEVQEWIDSHNRAVKRSGEGVRIISCLLPKKSPWLNSMEPKWVHGKRRVVEADGLLGAYELAERVCATFECPHYEHLSLAENVA
jgi:DDE superfamily endonuclease